MPTIAELEHEIRELVNNPRMQHALLQDAAAWNSLCSCLDTIGDTELAIDAHERSENPSEVGTAYLLVYGALQTLFVQQDALQNLCQALSIDYIRDPLLREIREIRHDSAGHPTKRGSGRGRAYNRISRSSLTKEGFDLITTYPDNREPLFRHVSLRSLVDNQRAIVQNVLAEVLGKLKKEEAEHRAKYRDQRLQDVFPSALGYYFEKIAEAIRREKPAEYGAMHISLVSETLEAFKQRLKERGILDAYDSIIYLLELLEYPILELTGYFTDARSSLLNSRSAYIFAFFIKRHIEELRVIAKELDEDYESEP